MEQSTEKVSTGPVVWYGGKGHLADRIVPLFPDHQMYVEPYGGAASLLFAKTPSPVEIYNDLHGDLVNLFRCLQNENTFEELQRRCTFTLKSRAEYEKACTILGDADSDDIDRAWAFFVTMNQGYGGTYPTPGRWSRDKGQRSSGGMSNNVAQWWRKVSWLDWWHERLARVQIEQRDALQLITEMDGPDTLFYVDPPYVPETRVSPVAYRYEQPVEHHEELVEVLLDVQGKVLLSGYQHSVYQPLTQNGWATVELTTAARGAKGNTNKTRTEVIWVSPTAQRKQRKTGSLF